MARRFEKVNEAAVFYPSDLVNTKTTIPLRVGEERFTSRYISITIYWIDKYFQNLLSYPD